MGKQRPRIVMRGRFAKAYTPPKTAQWESDASRVLCAYWNGPPIDQPVEVKIAAYRKRPKAMCTKAKSSKSLCVTKPDIDNVCKIVLDSLVKAGVLGDDNLVTDMSAQKRWAPVGDLGWVEVEICTSPLL